MQKEKLSALMDEETVDNVFLQSLSNDKTLQMSWQRYHLIRDVLRGDVGTVINLDIASRVESALEYEALPVESEISESQPTPYTWSGMSFWHKVRPWIGQLTQISVAACVSLVVVIGVQTYNSAQDQPFTELPVLNTLPMGGLTSPVSYGVSTEMSSNLVQKAREQREHVNSMLQDYELQRRLHAEQPPSENSHPVSDDLNYKLQR